MEIKKSVITWMIGFSLVLAGPISLAGEGPILIDGSRAVVVKNQLILTGQDGKRTVARPGIYDTRDGRYRFIVRGNDVLVQDHTKELR